MGHIHPRRLNGAEKAEVWRRWRQGESLQTIGRALGWVTKCMHYVVAGAGGVPPRPRRRSRWALTGAEREEISRGLANGASLRAVSRGLGRAASTVSREVRRHGGRRAYRAAVADTRAWARTRRPKVCRLATRPALRDAVAAKLALEWAPQQIAGWLRHAYPDDPEMHVMHRARQAIRDRCLLVCTARCHLRTVPGDDACRRRRLGQPDRHLCVHRLLQSIPYPIVADLSRNAGRGNHACS